VPSIERWLQRFLERTHRGHPRLSRFLAECLEAVEREFVCRLELLRQLIDLLLLHIGQRIGAHTARLHLRTLGATSPAAATTAPIGRTTATGITLRASLRHRDHQESRCNHESPHTPSLPGDRLAAFLGPTRRSRVLVPMDIGKAPVIPFPVAMDQFPPRGRRLKRLREMG